MSKKQIVLVPKGTFRKERLTHEESSLSESSIQVYLYEVIYGFVHKDDINKDDAHWHGANRMAIEYRLSIHDDIIIDIPSDFHFDHYLAYKFTFAPRFLDRGERFQMGTSYIDLNHPLSYEKPIFVKLPISNLSPQPYKDSQFLIKVSNFAWDNNNILNGDNKEICFHGKITRIYYGFTESSISDYLKTRDIPWINSVGQFKEEGIIDISQQQHHKQGDCFMMNDIWVRVPCYSINSISSESKDIKSKKTPTYYNVVWRIQFDKWAGKSWDIPSYHGNHETESFYLIPPVNKSTPPVPKRRFSITKHFSM